MHHHNSRKLPNRQEIETSVRSPHQDIINRHSVPQREPSQYHVSSIWLPAQHCGRLLPLLTPKCDGAQPFGLGLVAQALMEVIKVSMLNSNHDSIHEDTSFTSMLIPWQDDACAWTNRWTWYQMGEEQDPHILEESTAERRLLPSAQDKGLQKRGCRIILHCS